VADDRTDCAVVDRIIKTGRERLRLMIREDAPQGLATRNIFSEVSTQMKTATPTRHEPDVANGLKKAAQK
jgi:hypothetical protein